MIKPPTPKKHDFIELKPSSKRKRLCNYGKRTRDFIEKMLKEDGLGAGTPIEELDVIAAALKSAKPEYERYSDDIRSRTLPKGKLISDMDGLVCDSYCMLYYY